MKSKTIGGSKLSLLMACASPGSALAYHLGLASSEAVLMQRSTGAAGQPAAGPAEPVRSVVTWLTGLPAAVARWYAERERRELDRYLAQAQNVSDLEARMRDLHSGRYWLP
jgi:hypothetical protein